MIPESEEVRFGQRWRFPSRSFHVSLWVAGISAENSWLSWHQNNVKQDISAMHCLKTKNTRPEKNTSLKKDWGVSNKILYSMNLSDIWLMLDGRFDLNIDQICHDFPKSCHQESANLAPNHVTKSSLLLVNRTLYAAGLVNRLKWQPLNWHQLFLVGGWTTHLKKWSSN